MAGWRHAVETLTANAFLTNGLTTGTAAFRASDQWQRRASSGTWQDIAGATTSTYTVSSDDIGSELRVEGWLCSHGPPERVKDGA